MRELRKILGNTFLPHLAYTVVLIVNIVTYLRAYFLRFADTIIHNFAVPDLRSLYLQKKSYLRERWIE